MTHNYIVEIRDGDLTFIQNFITTAAEANNKHAFDEYAISLAVRFGQTAIFNYLVTLGANVDLVGDNGFAAVHWAVLNNNNTLLDSLITNGASMATVQSASGYDKRITLNTPLHLSAPRNYATITQTLLDESVNVNAVNSELNSPLHLCVKRNHSTMTQTLIDASANLDLQNNIGNTPLHISAMGDYTTIAQKLIDGGSDKTITNNDSSTAANLSISPEMDTILA